MLGEGRTIENFAKQNIRYILDIIRFNFKTFHWLGTDLQGNCKLFCKFHAKYGVTFNFKFTYQ